jgi:3-oxoacyl-[acyl-carrier-protein] synthase-3
VLASGTGFARLLAIAAVSDSRLEEMHRAGEAFGPVSGHAGWPVDLRARRKAYLSSVDAGRMTRWTLAGLRESVDQALAEAGLTLADIARVVVPNIGLSALRRSYLQPLGLDLAVTAWEWGRRTGHLGAADQFTGLTHLVESGHLSPGDKVMVVGIGAGFTWCCAIVELMTRPSWATAAGTSR